MIDSWHPAAEKFPLLEGAQFDALKESIKETNGIADNPIKYRMVRGKKQGLDGRNRLRACEELGIKPSYKLVAVTEKEVVPFVIRHNIIRRHLSAETRKTVVEELHKAGHTERQIATAINVPKSTVHRDLNASAPNGASPSESDETPEKGGETETNGSENARTAREEEPEDHQRVRAYLAEKPVASNREVARTLKVSEHTVAKVKVKLAIENPLLKDASSKDDAPPNGRKKKKKNGAQRFDWQGFDAPFGKVVRALDAVCTAYEGEKKSREYTESRRLLTTFHDIWESWKKRLTKV